MPTPRMSTPRQGARSNKITEEVVEGSLGNTYTILGGRQVKGEGVQANVGDVVHVQWSNGKPIRVIEQEVRRGATHFLIGAASKGIVEQLLISPSVETPPAVAKKTIWFRNFGQLTELRYTDPTRRRLYTDWANTPVDVFWGVNNDIFCVVEGTGVDKQYHVYRINRPGNTDADPTGGNNKIIKSLTTVTVKEKLYTIKPSTMAEVPLIDITLELRRDSVEPVIETVWNFDSGSCGGSCFFVVGLASPPSLGTTNVNKASVNRVVHVKAQGETIKITVDGQTAGEAGITVATINRPTASIASAIVNENNDLVWNLSVNCVGFSIGQGNPTTGLTGEYKRKGDGNSYPFGFFNIFATNFRTDPDYPFVIDDVGILDFMGHGNPGGVLTTSITEKHSVMVNARQATVLASTLASSKTLRIDETTDGQVPYVASRYVGFTDLGIHDPAVGPEHGYTYPFRSTTYNALFGPVTSFTVPGPRYYGVLKSERSLFAAGIPYSPDIVDRTTQIFDNLDEKVGFNTERTDGWDAYNGSSGFFLASNQCLETKYTIPTTDIIDRYTIEVQETLFYSTGGQLYRFVAVLRKPTNTPGSGHTTDPKQLGIFVMVGSTKYTIQDYTTVTADEVPVFRTGNARHVIWSFAGQLWIADFLREIKRTWSNTPARADTLQMTIPDFLYSYDEAKLFFVKGWNRVVGTLTLDDLDTGYPIKDSPVGRIGGLKKLPREDFGTDKDNHTIIDTALVPEAYRT